MAFPEYIRTDEREDVISTLEHVANITSTLGQRPLDWKWVIIAVHNAFQGSLVCTLSGTNGIKVLNKKSMNEMSDWLEISRSNPDAMRPDERLAAPLELYKRAKNKHFMSEFGGVALQTTTQQDNDVRRLNNLRRDFMHFSPRGWSIETAGLARIVLNAIWVVATLLLSHPANRLRMNSEDHERAKRAIDSIRYQLSSVQN